MVIELMRAVSLKKLRFSV